MHPHETGSPTPPAAHKLSLPLSWNQIAELDRMDTVKVLSRQFNRHQFSNKRLNIRIATGLGLMVASFYLLHPILGPLGVALCLELHHAWLRYRNRAWATRQILRIDPPTGRLRVVTVMLTRSHRGGCDRNLFTRLLTTAPDELSCRALGRHLRGYCPHAETAW